MVREHLCKRYVEWGASPPARDRTIHVAKPHGVRRRGPGRRASRVPGSIRPPRAGL